MKNFRNLDVWQAAHELTLASYRATAHFPEEEKFGLKSQIRRAAASVPENIAEGCGRTGNAELNRFLQIAAGSASELEYELLLAHDLCYLGDPLYEDMSSRVVRVKQLLAGLIRKVEADRLPA